MKPSLHQRFTAVLPSFKKNVEKKPKGGEWVGRPKKPVALQQGQLSNEDKRMRLEQEAKFLQGETNQLKPPKWLDDIAKKEFKRITKILIEMEVVQNLDLSVLAIYCDAFSNYVKLTEEISTRGAVETYINKFGAENKIVSSYVQAQHKYIDVIFKCASRLGLSVSDRLKLVVPTEDDSNDPVAQALRGEE